MIKWGSSTVALIKKFEGLRLRPYKCPAGRITIGYGHCFSYSNSFYEEITSSFAQDLLEGDLDSIYKFFRSYDFLSRLLTGNASNAFYSLCYNWGANNLVNSKGFKYLHKGDLNKAGFEFFSTERGVNKVNGRLSRGLLNRRAEEYKLWKS